MWRYNDVSMTQSWKHDQMSREVERVTRRSTTAWFHDLDRWQARRKGMIRAIQWLEEEHRLDHMLATTLAWNYFNPVTLPTDIARETIDSGAVRSRGRAPKFEATDFEESDRSADGGGSPGRQAAPAPVRVAHLRRAAHTVRQASGRAKKSDRRKQAAARTGRNRPGRGKR